MGFIDESSWAASLELCDMGVSDSFKLFRDISAVRADLIERPERLEMEGLVAEVAQIAVPPPDDGERWSR